MTSRLLATPAALRAAAAALLLLAAAGGEPAEFAPRGPYERLRTAMIFQSKGRLGVRRDCGPGDAPGVRYFPDVPYGPHPLQRLDLYLPPGEGFPLVVFIHGGAWISEGKENYGMIGRYLAAGGVGCAVVEYRLPPEAGVGDELRDAAAAFAWARRHAADFGADPDRLFLAGHSAGGHLAAVVALNPSYLAREGLGTEAVRGVVAFSGVYDLGANVRLLGVAYAFREEDMRDVSPVALVRPDAPPFLLVCAARESPYMRGQTKEFHRRLRACGARSELYVAAGEGHYGQLQHIAWPGRAWGPRVLEFILGP